MPNYYNTCKSSWLGVVICLFCFVLFLVVVVVVVVVLQLFLCFVLLFSFLEAFAIGIVPFLLVISDRA